MSREYDSNADRRDQESSELYNTASNAKDGAEKLSNLAEKFNDKKVEIAENRHTKGPSNNTSVSGNAEKANNNIKANQTAGKEAAEVAGRTGTKTASKEAGKEIAKEGVKEGAKQGAKTAAQGALASTGVGAAASAAIEAADKIKDRVKSVGESTAKVAKETAEEAGAAGGNVTAHKKKKAVNMAEDDTLVKMLITIFSVIAGILILVVVVIVSIIFTILAPVMNLFTAIHNGFDTAGNALADLNGKTSFQDIAYYYQDNIKDAMTKAFEETCYNETLQIAEEQEYDIELTMKSFSENVFPYVFEGENCNVNYSEILSVLSMDQRFNVLNFDYDTFMEVFEDTEFLRSLYDLKVERAELNIYDEDEYDENGVLIHQGTGELLETKIYGAVTIGKYPLKKLFDYVGVNPYASNLNFPSLTNYQALSIIQSYTKQEALNINWGSAATSTLKDYTIYTGEITTEGDNIYASEMYKDQELGNYTISNGVPVYSQGDPDWAYLPYGSGTIKALGCCLTSMSMVTSYFTGQTVTPYDMFLHIRENYNGGLYRAGIARDYGFNQYTTQAPFVVSEAVGELTADRLLIVHIKNGHLGHSKNWGHYVVISGCDTTSESPTFTINDPAGGKTYTLTASEAAYHLDYMWAYGT